MNEHFSGEYIAPTLVVDSVVFQLQDNTLMVLLTRRAKEPFAGAYALPGGYCAAGEMTRDAMSRVLKAKGGVTTGDLKLVEQLYTFDTIARDPRGHAISVTYMGLGREIRISESDTTETPTFYPVNDLPDLAYDHKEIIQYAHERLAAKLTYTNAIHALLPQDFTLSQLQTAYEAVLGRELDKRNFRKKFLSLDLIRETGGRFRDGAHRPAALYTFKTQGLESLSRSFD